MDIQRPSYSEKLDSDHTNSLGPPPSDSNSVFDQDRDATDIRNFEI